MGVWILENKLRRGITKVLLKGKNTMQKKREKKSM